MKKIIAWLLIVATTAALAVGGTLAYLTDTDEDVNVMTLGNVKIDQLEYERENPETNDDNATVQEFHDNKPLYPAVTENGFDWNTTSGEVDWDQIGKEGYSSDIWNPDDINNELDKMVFVKNKGDFDAYVRTVFAFEAGNYTTLEAYLADVHLNLNGSDWTWAWSEPPFTVGEGKYFIATATYNKVLVPDALTELSLSQIALDPSVTNEDVAGFGDTYQVLVQSQAVQADGFDGADTALTAAFGAIIADKAEDGQPPFELIPDDIPFEEDNPVEGIDLKTALHYYEGDITGTKITTNVTNVVFGLNKEYANIVDTYEGTLVDVEQDVPVYAYYVENGSDYDVYFLANDDIYTPQNSTELFLGMNRMVALDTGNLNTGRTEIFSGFLKDCNALAQITGVENWQTANALEMDNMFNNCFVLDNLDLSGWDMSNVHSVKNMFRYCHALKNFDASTWKLDSVTDMAQMFLHCRSLVELKINSWGLGKEAWRLYLTFGNCANLEVLEVGDWDISGITDLTGTFQHCYKLKTIDVARWDTSNVTTMHGTFNACTGLEELDISNWDVRKVTNFTMMFQGKGSNAMDMKIKKLDVSKWEPNSAERIGHMFYGCAQLTELDLSGWNMPNLYTTSHMFADCINLEVIDVSGWRTGEKWLSMDAMFNDCRKVKFLDVSSFTTSGVTEFSQIFEACWALEEIKGLENWDTSNGKSFDQTFLSCGSLKELNLSSFDTGNACYGNKHLNGDVSTGFSQMFSGCNSLQKLILGEKFDFDGNGTVTAVATLPNPGKVDGQSAMWYNAANGTYYAANEIPEMTAATYVAAVKPADNG